MSGSGWQAGGVRELTKARLQELFENKIAAIYVDDFAGPTECAQLLDSARTASFEAYQNVWPRIDRVGVTQYEAGARGKAAYFEKSEAARRQSESLFERSFNPVDRMKSLLAAAWAGPVELAAEDDGRSYFAGLIRSMNEGTQLHVDFAQHDAPDWCIDDIDAQIAWNLYLTTGESGGKCEIFNQQWNTCDEVHKKRGEYGYSKEVLRTAESHMVVPVIGRVVLFNCRNYHEVEETGGPRVTIGSFVGRMSDRLVLWS